MKTVKQSPTDPAFVQNPYAAYDDWRATGDFVWWEEYAKPCAVSFRAVNQLLRDRRFGREVPPEMARPIPEHCAPFYAIEANSMLELEPPRHTRLRGLVLRAFTSRRIKALAPEIDALTHDLIDRLPEGGCDMLSAVCQPLPVTIIARMLGVPEEMTGQLLDWSNRMVAMYQARRDRAVEEDAARASTEFTDFLRGYIDQRRKQPADDLLTELIAAEEDGDKLTTDEMIATAILLLNAGHEATVHGLGIAIKTLLEHGMGGEVLTPDRIDGTVEELMRYDPPLHMFSRYVYEDTVVYGQEFKRGDEIGLMLGAANRDPDVWDDPGVFDPTRHVRQNMTFGAGLHFCIGAPLARLELAGALPILFDRLPKLALEGVPEFADIYHFHGLKALNVTY